MEIRVKYANMGENSSACNSDKNFVIHFFVGTAKFHPLIWLQKENKNKNVSYHRPVINMNKIYNNCCVHLDILCVFIFFAFTVLFWLQSLFASIILVFIL